MTALQMANSKSSTRRLCAFTNNNNAWRKWLLQEQWADAAEVNEEKNVPNKHMFNFSDITVFIYGCVVGFSIISILPGQH